MRGPDYSERYINMSCSPRPVKIYIVSSIERGLHGAGNRRGKSSRRNDCLAKLLRPAEGDPEFGIVRCEFSAKPRTLLYRVRDGLLPLSFWSTAGLHAPGSAAC
jgi:hypothetical protein